MTEHWENLTAITAPLLAWYNLNGRTLPWRSVVTPYRTWVSEIMLQQTRVGAVIPYFERFMEELPDVSALAAVSEERLLKLWEGLGYYSRARNLQRAAKIVVSDFGGALPQSYHALLSLPGIGEYTAAAIASINFSEPVAAVDGNLLRVAARVSGCGEDIMDAKVRRLFRQRLDAAIDLDRPGAYNQAMMDLGATVCLPNGAPKCEICPARTVCEAYKNGLTEVLPVRAKKKSRRVEERTVLLLFQGGKVALRKRPDSGLLASLWQLPDAPGLLDAAQAAARLDAWGAEPLGEWRFYERRHLFTHVEWRMRVCALPVALDPLPEGWVWLDDAVHSLPAAYRVCL